MANVEQIMKKRLAFLYTLYNSVEGDITAVIAGSKIGMALDFTRNETANIARYLVNENLIKPMGFGPSLYICITHKGLIFVEGALKSPRESFEGYPPIEPIIVEIGSIQGSQVQIGTSGSLQILESGGLELENLKELIVLLRDAAEKVGFPKEQQEELRAEISTLEAQASSPKPKVGVIKEALASVRTIFEGAAGGGLVVAGEYLPEIIKFIQNLV
jgi:hypothetical protein